MMVTDKVSNSECMGCSACANICPKGIIDLKTSDEGFEVPVVDKEKCIQCGLCEKVCPYLNPITKLYCCKKGYAAWSYDSDTRNLSTSGGVFTELAEQVLKQGGKVVGARYDYDNCVVHYMASTREGIAKLRQSKYVQSRKGTIFSEIERELKKGTRIMFVGTPCEVAGLKLFLRQDYENLLMCDFICKGAASPKAYEAYLEELEKKYDSKVELIWFKEKSYGWNNFSTKIIFENGNVYKKDRYHDWYMRGYVEDNLFLRKSCFSCKFKGNNRFSDITLADFWGAGKICRKLDYDLGTSLVITNTAKGEVMLDSIKDKIFMKSINLEEALKGNYAYSNSAIPSENRDCFFMDIKYGVFSEVVKKYVEKSYFSEFKRGFRNKIHWFVRKGRIILSRLFE